MLVESGCHPSKIVLGIPAYGRDSRNPRNIKTHHEVVDALVKENNHDEEGILSIEGDGEAVFIESFASVKDKVKIWFIHVSHKDSQLRLRSQSKKKKHVLAHAFVCGTRSLISGRSTLRRLV